MTLSIDYTNMLSPVLVGGILDVDWQEQQQRFPRVRKALVDQDELGRLGFLDLPANTALRQQVREAADWAKGRFDDVVVLGIGGSALGPIALRTALRPPGWNMLDATARDGWPRLHVLDNVDPVTIAALLDRLDLARSLFLVTSKSGGTAETMAQYLVVRGRLDQASLAAGAHLVFITDPEKGALRAIARREGIRALDIPANVGGRFSVLTGVGLLPAALTGVDTDALLAGAGDMAQRCATDDLRASPAAVFAVLQWLADEKYGRPVHVMMPYSDPLRDFAAWYVQLWAESLGKGRGDQWVGPTPIAALGATDQHSQVQLFMEGPQDKTVTFIAVGDGASDVAIPALHPDIPELAYLGGHRLGELLDIERRATAGALARRGRPNMTITIDRVDPWHLGALVMMLEIATIHAGTLYGVNPLDQPGVELGKQFAYAMLGRADAEQARQEWNLLPRSNPAHVV